MASSRFSACRLACLMPHSMKPLLITILCFGLSGPCFGLSTRQQAVAALRAPGSGVSLPSDSVVWAPFTDFGFGPGFEGLLPPGTVIEPRFLGIAPVPGSAITVAGASFFFWIDDEPFAEFMHPTRFVLVDSQVASPTMANGGIQSVDQGWWPVLRLPPATTLE